MSQQRRSKRKLSLHPLKPEDALRGFMRVDPEKVKEAAERERQKKSGDKTERGQ